MFGKFRKYFFAGLAAFLPIALTVYLLVLFFNLLDGILGKYLAPYFQREFGFYIKGIGIILFISIITFIGVLASSFLDRRIYAFFEGFLVKLPFFKQVYPAVKEISSFILPQGKPSFQQVVLTEYPSKGIFSMGFLTNTTSSNITQHCEGEDFCTVLIPTMPNPLSGFIIIVPRKNLKFRKISVDEAIKFFVSGGVVNPGSKLRSEEIKIEKMK